ncbi:hypothetical protein PQX77_014010 [Marasmius sp. AFHP31]|nr:hypothetical protein PQX77_014010 [Marasmius sp. AFHP31]
MGVIFDNKSNVLFAKRHTTLDDAVIYTLETTYGFRGRRITILKDSNPAFTGSSSGSSTVGAIDWREKTIEVNGVRKKVGDLKKRKGRGGVFRNARYWQWAAERKEYEVKFKDEQPDGPGSSSTQPQPQRKGKPRRRADVSLVQSHPTEMTTSKTRTRRQRKRESLVADGEIVEYVCLFAFFSSAYMTYMASLGLIAGVPIPLASPERASSWTQTQTEPIKTTNTATEEDTPTPPTQPEPELELKIEIYEVLSPEQAACSLCLSRPASVPSSQHISISEIRDDACAGKVGSLK